MDCPVGWASLAGDPGKRRLPVQISVPCIGHKVNGGLVIAVPGVRGFESDPDHKRFYDAEALRVLDEVVNAKPVLDPFSVQQQKAVKVRQAILPGCYVQEDLGKRRLNPDCPLEAFPLVGASLLAKFFASKLAPTVGSWPNGSSRLSQAIDLPCHYKGAYSKYG